MIESGANKGVIASQNINERDYWLEKLSGDLTRSYFYYDNGSIMGKEMDIYEFTLDDNLCFSLSKLSNGSDYALHMILTAAIITLLYKYTGNEDVIVGSPIYKQEVDGEFINTVLSLRTQIYPDMTFKSLLLEVRKTIIEADKNQNYPIDSLLYKLGMESDVYDFPLFSSALLLENIHEKKYIEHISLGTIFSFIRRADNKIEGRIEYNAQRYNRETIERIVLHYTYVLRNAASNVNQLIKNIEIYSSKEKDMLLYGFNNILQNSKEPRLPFTIHGLFEEQVKKTPLAKAVVYEDQHISYSELNNRANYLANILRENGAATESIVAIIADRSIEMIVGILAILKSGSAYLPIDSEYPEERKRFLLEDSGAEILLAQDEYMGRVNFEGKKISLSNKNIELDNTSNFKSLNNSENAAYIIYTSGSTGEPKGVVVEHEAIINTLLWRREYYKFNQEDVVLQIPSFAFDSSVEDIFTPLISGSSIVMLNQENRLNLNYLKTVIEKNKITHFLIVPNLYKTFLSEIYDSLKQVKSVTVAGDSITAGLVEEHFDKLPNVQLYNEYGPTENGVCTTVYKFVPEDKRVLIGKPIKNVTCYIIGKNGELNPIGVPGELCVSGNGLARGYHNRPDLTWKKFVENSFMPNCRMYKTGDLARWLKDGNIEFIGRIDNQVKVRGFRIEPGEIENIILKFNGVKEAAVLAYSNESEDKYLCAYLVTDDNVTCSKAVFQEDLKEHIKGFLPEYMIPYYFVFMEELPLTSNGKLNRKALPNPQMISTQESEFLLPSNEIEETLVNIWGELLKVDRISTNHTFFELGGHSVLAIQMISRVRKQLKVNLSLKDFFENPRLDELARVIDKNYHELVFDESLMVISQEGEKTHCEASPIQYPEWYLLKLNPGSVFYNVIESVRLKGDLQVKVFIDVLNYIVRRHDILRSAFFEVDGKPYLRLYNDIKTISVDDVLDIRQLQNRDEELKQIVIKAFDTVFDLKKAPVYLMKLIRVQNDEYVFLFVTNHIMWDQLSSFNFYREIQTGYNLMVSGQEIKLPELRINFFDYARWINKIINNGNLEKHRKYWLDKYSVLPEQLNLPFDYTRPPIQAFRGKTLINTISLKQKAEIDEFCKKNNVTHQIFLLSILNMLLHRLTFQKDFVVGTPIANRDNEDIEPLMGLFASALPIRCNLNGSWSFMDLMEHTKQVSVEAYDNHLYPFNKVIEELHCNMDFSRTKIISVFFGVQNDETELFTLKLNGIEAEGYSIDYDSGTTAFDFTLQVDYALDYMVFSLRYDTDLFKESTAQKILNRYIELIPQCLTSPEMSIERFNILDEDDRIIIESNAKNPWVYSLPDIGIHSIVENSVKENSSMTAVVYKGKNYTYKDVNETSNQIAHYLMNMGINKSSRVGLFMPPSFNMITTLLGILKCGAVYIPLSDELPLNRIKNIVSQAGIDKIVTCSDYMTDEIDKSFKDKIVNVDKERVNILSQKKDNPSINVYGEDSAYIIFTSGSTGAPKGIEICHRGINNLITSTQQLYNLNNSDTVLFHTPIIFDASILDILYPLATGARIVVLEQEKRNNISAICEYINNYEVTIAQFVPLVLEKIVNAKIKGEVSHLPSLKNVIVGGAILTKTLRNKFLGNFNCKLNNHYGPTEITVDASRFDCSLSFDGDIVPVGKPIGNTALYVLDNHMNTCPIGISGELYISSLGNAKGYLNNHELTMESFIDNIFKDGFSDKLYKTGDKALYTEDGNILILGRLDNQVKVNGNRIEIDEIENRLLSNEHIHNAAVIVDKSEQKHERLLAFIEVEESLNTFISKNGSRYRMYTVAQNPALKKDFDALHHEAWPSYFSGSEILKKYWNMLYSVFPEFQFTILNEEGKVCGIGNSIPLYWDGTPDNLPKGWDGAVQKGFKDMQYKSQINTVVILAGVVDSNLRGEGLSKFLIEGFKALASNAAFKHCIGIIRPIGKVKHQNLSIDEYVNLKNEENLCKDNWLRIHQQEGGVILKVEFESQYIKGSISDWEKWTLQSFKDLEDYYFNDTLDMVSVDFDSGIVEYYDPGVWFDHSLCGSKINWSHIDEADLKDYLAEYLPMYMIPNKMFVMNRIPKLDSGKNDKLKLKEVHIDFANDRRIMPKNSIQIKLQEFFHKVLDTENIGIYESFFELGGHSINALVLLSKIEKYFNVKVPVIELFKNPNIYKLANYIEDNNPIVVDELYIEQLSQGGRNNLICIPSISTMPIEFMELANAIPEVACYALNMALLNEYENIGESVDNIICQCVQMIESLNIDGPITIMGYSTGARLGYEVVKALEAKNLNIEKLIVIDSTPNITRDYNTDSNDIKVDSGNITHPYYECLSQEEKEKLASLIRKYMILDSYIVNCESIKAPIYIIFNADESVQTFESWSNLTSSKVIFHKGGGNHYQLIDREFIKLNKSFFERAIFSIYEDK